MFSLVQFDNMDTIVIPSKRVKIIQDKSCIVKYKNGSKYCAELLETSDNVNNLMNQIEDFKSPKKPISSSTPVNSTLVNSTYSLNSTSDAPSGFTDELNNLGLSWPNADSGTDLENHIYTTSIIEDHSVANVQNVTESEENDFHLNHDNYSNQEHLNDYSEEIAVNDIDCENHNSKLARSDKDDTITESDITIDNNTEDDSSFHPEQSATNTTKEVIKTIDDSSIKEHSSILDEGCPLNIQELTVPVAKSKETKSKKHFCPFCKTLQTKFARHLLLKHKTEEQVKKFIHLPHKNRERMDIINAIRKKGDFMHNTKPELNSGILIVSRQKQIKSKNVAEDYVCCKSCRGFFSKLTIRFHSAKCDKNRRKGQRDILSSSRHLTGYIHSIANNNLRRVVFPILTDDEVVRSIKYDELIIMYGNKLCDRYTLPHQHDYIRTQLRMLGRVKLEMMKLEKNIHEFKDIFHPQYFNQCIECLRVLAEWDESSGVFKVPFNAQFISTLIKKCAKKLRTECIKLQDHDRKKLVDDYLLLWEEEIPTLISKKAFNDQMDLRRGKKVVLPSRDDIKRLYDYLKDECYNCLEILDSEFDLEAYKLLLKCTLTLVQIFNRRRAGEIERLSLVNYENRGILNDNVDKELYQKLSDETKEFAKQFTRLAIRGKLERTVPVLLCPLAVKCVDTLLMYRKQAGVPDDNQFIFCSLNKKKLSKPYLRACPLLKRFANECGAVLPSSLTGTQLRKHVATYTSMLNVEESRVDRLANFMGHHKDIHKSIYRVPVPVTEITDVSKLLMAAIGEDEDNDKGSDDDDQNSDSSSDDEEGGQQETTSDSPANDAVDCPQENGPSSHSRNKSEAVKCHNLSSAKKIKRMKWSDAEKTAIRKYFGDLTKLSKLPSLRECRKVINKYKVLKNRTPTQIFSYINNQRRRC